METLIRYGGAYLVDDLLLNRMSVADAAEFNDPFEFHFTPGKPLSTSLAKRRVKRAMRSPKVRKHQQMVTEKLGLSRKEKRQILKENWKGIVEGFKAGDRISVEELREEIFSFTREAAKIVCCTRNDAEESAENCMWAYYADCHRGVRLHLKKSFYSRLVQWFEMEYLIDPPVFETSAIENPEVLIEFVFNAIGRKSSVWKHEKEVRLLIPISETFIADDIHGIKRYFTSLVEEQVERIDFGIRYDKASLPLERIAEKLPSVSIFRAIKSPDSYKIHYEQIR